MFDSTPKNVYPYKTSKKIKFIDGLLTLSSSNKKKFSLNNVNKTRYVTIDMHFNNGMIRRDLFSKFLINILQYILYDKNAIPIPFGYVDKLQDFLSNQDGSRKKTLLDTFSKLKLVFDFFCSLFLETKIHISCVALCLGDSMRFAKEVFIINLEKLNLYNENNIACKNLPFLTLRYMIDSFYKRLLNEIPEELPQTKTSHIKNAKNILFSVRTTSKHIDELKTFVQFYSKENRSILETTNFSFNLSNYSYRLGSVLSTITHFVFDHRNSDTPNPDNFDIYLEDDEVEVIQEKIIIADDIENVNSCDESSPKFEQPATFKDNSKTNEDLLDNSSTLVEEFNSLWIQISPTIQCITKV